MALADTYHDGGSPPQVRGKALAVIGHIITERITPAGAGKREIDLVVDPLARDHPRGCGEKSMINAQREVVKGSPPRVRGKV